MPSKIRIQWNAGTACVSECVPKTIACWGLRVGPSKPLQNSKKQKNKTEILTAAQQIPGRLRRQGSFENRGFAKGVAGTVSLPIFSVLSAFFRFFSVFSLFSFRFFRLFRFFPFFPFFRFFLFLPVFFFFPFLLFFGVPILSVFFFRFLPFLLFFSVFPFSSFFFSFHFQKKKKTGRHRSRDPFKICETPIVGLSTLLTHIRSYHLGLRPGLSWAMLDCR